MTLMIETMGSLGVITLNRPQALHALTGAMIEGLIEHLTLWKHDPSIRAVIIQATPSKAFCAGGDVRWIYEQRGHFGIQSEFFAREYRLNQLIYDYPKPYIAWMDGLTMGGGVGVSLHGSHPIASEHFVFAMPETAIGFFPDIGASYLLSRCPGDFGIYLGLTGDRLGPLDAQGMGLIKARVLSQDFPLLMDRLLAADFSDDAFATVDACLGHVAQPLDVAPWLSKQATIDACFGLSQIEDIMHALQKTQEDWCFSIHTNLCKKSPLALKVALEQLRRARAFSLKDCLEQDLKLTKHFLQDHDFYEGVRAVVIDKDQNPHWRPAQLSEITADRVQQYFS